MKKKKNKLSDKDFNEVLKKLDIDPEEGLNNNEASNRKEKYGSNEIEAEDKNPVIEFLSHFRGPIPWMIEEQQLNR